MQIIITERFQKDFSSLPRPMQQQACAVLMKLPAVLRDPHRHSGAGVRKLHHSGIFEARIGLNVRMIFGLQKETLIVHRIGNHDDVQQYLKQL